MVAENTAKQQRGRQFQRGQSGNPSGRPRGARNKATLVAQEIFDDEVEGISRKAIEMAKDGNIAAIRLVIERVLPPRKDAPVSIDLPAIETVEDIATATARIVSAVSHGDLTPSEGQAVADLLEQQRKCMETAILERKIDMLHAILNARK